MNKKVMAIAVAGALAAPGLALAQASTVQIGGSITTFYYSHNPNNPLTGQRTDILETSEPELFVAGEEALGGGLSVWFRCTSSLDGLLGGAASAQGWCGRNSGIGFKGAFGNVFQGNWDTPQKLVFNRGRGWFGSTNSLTGGTGRLLFGDGPSGVGNPVQTIVASPVIGLVTGAGTGTTSASPQGFARRQASSWNYWSPVWQGFQALASFSAGNQQTGVAAASPLDPRLWSLAAHYDNGPLYLGAAYERHNDYNPGNTTIGAGASAYGGGDDSNWTLVAGYTFAKVFSLRGLYSRSDYDVTNSAGLKVSGWAAYADWTVQGPHTLRAQYVRVGDSKGATTQTVGSYRAPGASTCGPSAGSLTSCASNTGARIWTLAYSYAFSKRTEGSLVYTRLSNDSGVAYTLGKVASTAGNNQTSTGMVLRHRF